jgi:hypothetical protein
LAPLVVSHVNRFTGIQGDGLVARRSVLSWIGACSVALFLPLLYPLLSGRVFTRDDLAAWHLPFRFVYWQALHAGDSFLWTPAVLSGVYLHGEGEAGLTHPLHLFLYRLLPLGPAFNLEIAASYVAMFAGTGLLFLQLGLTAEAAWFGGMLFAFSGFNLFNLMHVNHIATIAHAPWILLGIYVLMTANDGTRRAWAFAGVAGAVASQLLIGNPQYVWLTMIAAGYLTVCTVIAGAPVSRVVLLAAAMICGGLAGGIQLLPTMEFARESTRALWSLDQSLSFSLSPLNLVQLWSPFAFRFRVHAPPAEASIVHEFIVYNGAFCTVALAWLAMRWREQTRKGLLTALLAFAAVTIVLAMGRYGGVYSLLARLPGISNFRAPARHLVLFQLTVSAIAAIVFEDLIGLLRRGETIPKRRLWPLAVPAVLSVALTALAAVLAPSAWAAARDLTFSGPLRAAPWTLPILATVFVVMMAARGRCWPAAALVALAAVDLGAWGYSYAYRWGPIQSITELAANASVPPGAQPGELIEPMPGGGPINLPILRGIRLTSGYNGLEPVSILDPNDPVTERISGVTWRPRGTSWTSVADGMPRARLVAESRLSRDVKADVRSIDVARVALVSESIPSLSGSPGAARIVSDRPGSMIVDTDASGPQLLVVTERFHSGWQAVVDGQPRRTTRVYGDFLGCVVDSGRHRVTFTFAPDSVRQGLRLSLGGILLTVVAATLLWRGGAQVRVEDPAAALRVTG